MTTEYVIQRNSGGEVLEAPGTYSYQTGTNKLTHIAATPPVDYGYDSNGNITTEDGWTYVYDLSNQLIRVLSGGNQAAEYTFNGAGQRVKKVTQTETRIFHYDLRGHIIAETSQTGQMLAEYVYLGDQLLAMIKPGESAYYFHNDLLGTPQVLTSESQGIAWKASYTPFGEAVTSIATVENPFRFPGQYYDQETGLHYNYHRYYNPPIGRYLTPDPIGLKGGINLFAYSQNNPILYFDPTGELIAEGVMKWIAIDLATPDPSDLAWVKWAGYGVVLGGAIAIEYLLLSESTEDSKSQVAVPRSIPRPDPPRCGCTCICRADADETVPGNIKPGMSRFAFGTHTASNCAEAAKEAKRTATHLLGMKPKHIGCRCAER